MPHDLSCDVVVHASDQFRLFEISHILPALREAYPNPSGCDLFWLLKHELGPYRRSTVERNMDSSI